MDNLIEMQADGDLSKDMFRMKSEELEPKMQKLQKEIDELSQKREPKVVEPYKEKLTILQYALSQYSCPKEGEDVPESVIEAYFSKIVVKKDGFDWYIRINGDPNKPLHCKLEGKRRSTTKIVVTQDFSPALDSSTTGCYQGLIPAFYPGPFGPGFCFCGRKCHFLVALLKKLTNPAALFVQQFCRILLQISTNADRIKLYEYFIFCLL